MSQLLRTTRFGEISVDDADVLDFPAGLIGLGGRRYALVAHGTDSPFSWLQSADDPALALPVTSPWSFFPDFEVRVAEDDRVRIGSDDIPAAGVYVTVRVDEDGGFAANLAAPIVIAGGRAHQVLNQVTSEFRAPLFATAAAA